MLRWRLPFFDQFKRTSTTTLDGGNLASPDFWEHAVAVADAKAWHVTHRRAIKTTNLLERLFVEELLRLKIIPNAFGEKPVLKLMFGAMIRAAER